LVSRAPLTLSLFPTRRSSDLVLHQPARGPITNKDVLEGHQASIAAGNEHMPHRHSFSTASLEQLLHYVGFEDPHVTFHDYEIERSEEHTSELQSLTNLVCRLL